MHQPVRVILLVLLLSILTLPAVGSAGGVLPETTHDQPGQSINDAVTDQIPALPQMPDIKFHEAGAPPDTVTNSSNISPENQKERIKVIYDTDTEKDRGKTMVLVIAFGISLALNIYLATALFSARRRL